MSRFTFVCIPPAALLMLVGGCPQPGSDTAVHSLVHDGRTRTYRVVTPSAATSATDQLFALVLAFHGTGQSGAEMERLSGLDDVARANGFFVAYPDGVDGQWADGRPGTNPDIDDVAFVGALLDGLTAAYPIDPARVYATGLSNGGHMCYRLAFDLGNRIAAIAPVGALLSVGLAQRATRPEPMPLLIIAGDEDPISPYGGGESGGAYLDRGEVLSARATADYWITANGAMTNVAEVDYYPDADLGDGTRSREETYAAADVGGAGVILVTVEGGGHTWPGGEQYLPPAVVGRTARDFSASQRVWSFFAAVR